MGTKANPGEFDCYEKAADDEPIFTLRAKDPIAPSCVRKWADIARLNKTQPEEKIEEAYRCANAMDEWFRKNV